MNRPKILHVGGVLYWTIQTYNPDKPGVLKDADSTPSVAVRKNGASTGDSVTIYKRSATTGIYDCSYNPAGEVEGDEFTIEESATVTGTTTAQATYSASWEFTVIALERGTDGANTTSPPTAAANASAVRTELSTELGRIDAAITTRLASESYTAPANSDIAAIKVVTDRINTGLVADGPVWQFTANMLELGPSGGSGDAEQATSLEILDKIDALSVGLAGGSPVEPTGVTVFEQLNLIQSNTSSLSNLTASLPLSPGVIVGPSEPLVIGDDYTSAVGRQVRVNLLSSTGGSAATAFGSKSLSDAGISIQLLLRKSGQPSAVAQLVGTCSFFPAETVDGVEIPPYLLVSFSRTETAKATPGVYDMQGEAVWLSGDVVTFAPYGQIEFVRNIQRVG